MQILGEVSSRYSRISHEVPNHLSLVRENERSILHTVKELLLKTSERWKREDKQNED
jgi:hypothetical protein